MLKPLSKVLCGLFVIYQFSSCAVQKRLEAHSFYVTLQSFEKGHRWRDQVKENCFWLQWIDDFNTPYYEPRTDSNFYIGQREKWKTIEARNK